MKLFAMLLSLSLAGAALAAENTLTDQEVAAGWKLLFDGKTAAGWRALGPPTRSAGPAPLGAEARRSSSATSNRALAHFEPRPPSGGNGPDRHA